ncbi:hypothetical protein GCK72_026003 [Caenorhabditis remanei]|uniref:MRG domain-containing protein n=1 Tax=Caenorhabditis remanei TaxID=31234 RepID=A0A6A5G4A5_CAERE|nr:hypothetical protein GCK72_026003 [Caenorhabditis remanei]KAF1749535.1 hypothetical protein GCK72_026003 [Caenorhabditis remanei]
MSAQFAVGENFVMLYDGAPYLAIVSRIVKFNGVDHYKVHYVGWNKKFDDIVAVGQEEGRMFKGTLDNYLKGEIVQEKPEPATPKTEENKTIKRRSPVTNIPSPVKKSDPNVKAKVITPQVKEVASFPLPTDVTPSPAPYQGIMFPPQLGKIVTNDVKWLRAGYYCPAPAKVPMTRVLKQYFEYLRLKVKKETEETNPSSTAADVELVESRHSLTKYRMERLMQYFGHAIPFHLLYGKEEIEDYKIHHKFAMDMDLPHVDYAQLDRVGFKYSDHYGVIHFLRLLTVFSDIQNVLPYRYNTKELENTASDFLIFLELNLNKFYVGGGDYLDTEPPFRNNKPGYFEKCRQYKLPDIEEFQKTRIMENLGGVDHHAL